jgi:predicted RNA binding protein YcfA (HicA-like mRNA interferase family)
MLQPATPAADWVIAPDVIKALTKISDEVYIVLPRGARPIFKPTSIDPGATISSRELIIALTKHHGYQQAAGGKGSHIKLTKPGAPNIHVPGNRPVLSPGIVKQALKAVGGHPISSLPDFKAGKLGAIANFGATL